MYKAIQSYNDPTSADHILRFEKGEVLCLLEKTNSSWWLASNSQGKIGYVPSTYIKIEQSHDSKDVVLQSIDRAMAAVYASAKNKSLSSQQSDMLNKLTQYKKEMLSSIEKNKLDYKKRQAPPPPVKQNDTPPAPPRSASLIRDPVAAEKEDPDKKLVFSEKVIPVPILSSQTSDNQGANSSKDELNIDVPAHLGQDLIDLVQCQCSLGEAQSTSLIRSIAALICENIPSISLAMQNIVETLPVSQITTDPNIDKLGLALANLMEIKDDAQQRNWAIEDDEQKITGILNEIIDSLSTANKIQCIEELLKDDCSGLVTLAVYHQMESRVNIRILILQIFGLICSLSEKFISALLTTVLPNELVRDIMEHCDDIQRTCFSALVLSMVFSTGEPVPVSYQDTIGDKFFSFLLDSIENGLEDDTHDQVGDIFVRLLLSLNLHFLIPEDNLMVDIISKKICTTLSEKIMLLVNRGDDPVVTCESTLCQPPHSVLKFLQDIFSRNDTAMSFLYTNDLLVLIDIILRNISDLSPGSKARTEYLDLLLNMFKRSSYDENKHRASEILSVLERISGEEIPVEEELLINVEFDKKIVNVILQDYKNTCLI